MSTAAFATMMFIILFAFIAAMIWAYRKNDYEQEKPKVESVSLNSFEDTIKMITSTVEPTEIVKTEKVAEESEQKTGEDDPLTKIETENRKKMIQDKNRIKKSAADEYFERTKNVANEILQRK